MRFWQGDDIKILGANVPYVAPQTEGLNLAKEDDNLFENYFNTNNSQYSNNASQTLEENFQGYILESLSETQQNAHAIFDEQNKNDGFVSQSYNIIKETLNLGVSDKDVQKALKKQDKNLEKLEKAYKENNGENFKKVYKEITGVEFDPQKLLDYEQKTAELNFVQEQIDNADAFGNSLIEAKSTEELYELYKNYYKDETVAKEELSEIIKKSYNTSMDLGGGVSEVKIDDDNNVTITQDGYEFGIGNLKDLNIDSGQFIARLTTDYGQQFIDRLEETTGINYKELKEQYCELHEEAIGKGDSVYNLVEKYSQDQESFTDKVAMVAQMGGLALMAGASAVTGGGAAMVFGAGQVLAISGMFSDEALETVDIITSENNKDLSRYGEVAKDAALDATFLLTGSAIGATSSALAADVLSSTNSQTLSLLTEIGSDATLSLLGDYILTGKIDISAEAFSQFMGVVTGISATKKALGTTPTKGSIEERTKILNEKALDASNVEGNRTDLFTRLENLSLKDIDYDPTITEAAKDKKTTYNLARIADAKDFLDGGKNYKKILDYTQEIVDSSSDSSHIIGTMNELTNGLKLNTTSEITQIPKTNIYTQTAENEVVTGRTKGHDSVYSKLKNKVLKLGADMPQSVGDAKNLVADLQGTRVVFDAQKVEVDTSKLKVEGISEADRVEFFDFIRNKADTSKLSEEKIELYRAHEKEGLLAISEAQSSKFVENLGDAIQNDDIRIKEIHNYAPKDGLAYLTHEQIEHLKSSYSNWFNDKLQQTRDGGSEFQIIERQGKVILYDPKTDVEYNQEMEIVTAYVDEKAHRDNGYTCVQFNFVNSEGHLEEFQYRGKDLDAKAEKEHNIYDIIKDKTTADKPENDLLKEQIKILKDTKTYSEYNRYIHDVFLYERKVELGVVGLTEPKIEDYPLIASTLTKASEINNKEYDVKLLSINPSQGGNE